MRGRSAKHGLLVVALMPLIWSSAYAAPKPITAADKADVACLALLEFNRAKMLEAGAVTDPQKQTTMQGLLQVTAFFLGKLSARHPGERIDVVAKSINTSAPDMKPLFDANRCSTEFKSVVARKGG